MRTTARGMALIITALAAVLAVAAPSGAAQPEPVPPPPSAETLVTTTNAMMQPSDIPATLRHTSSWAVYSFSPPGGQDPMPACVYGPQGVVSLSIDDATGYQAGYSGLFQDVNVYADASVAQAAWSAVDRQLGASCKGSWTQGSTTTTVSAGRLAPTTGDAPGWWVRSDVTRGEGDGTYLTVMPVGDAIQLVYLSAATASATPAQRAAIDALSGRLATRLAAGPALPLTQDALMTAAQRSMVTPADAPAALPYTLPADGGWSGFQAYFPGNGPWACGPAELPKGVASFAMSFGGQGGVQAEPGAIDQSIEAYADATAAHAAWSRLSASVRSCAGDASTPLSQTKPVSRLSSGTSALSFDGVAGVWSRSLDTYPGDGSTCTTDGGTEVACEGFTSKTYTIHLLAGAAIQSVTYYVTADGIRQIPLDQVAVNALAETLAQRWVATSSAG